MELLQGYVQPEVPAGTQAAVFAVYEQGRSLQYIGFSKDLRNSLRTLFGRRPDKAHFYRHVTLLTPNAEKSIGRWAQVVGLNVISGHSWQHMPTRRL